MTESDSSFVSAVLAGNLDAFGPLVTRYQEPVYALVWSIVRDPAAAEDVVQEAFITAYRRLSELRDPNVFAPWLRRIAVNTARMWLRRDGRRGEAAGEMDEMPAPSEAPGAGLREEIAEILASLPEKKRGAAMLCFRDGVSRKDAARLLGIQEAALRKRLHDAKRVLQRRIVEVARRSFSEHLLPVDFAERCVCGCKRAREVKRKEVTPMKTGKSTCGCGCLPVDKPKVGRRGKRKTRPVKVAKAGR
jgi:RNA polymerase sigma factor (sigma-70 family)